MTLLKHFTYGLSFVAITLFMGARMNEKNEMAAKLETCLLMLPVTELEKTSKNNASYKVESEETKMKKILETERLMLRQFVMEDDKALLEILADGGMPHLSQFGPLDIGYARGFLNRMLENYQNEGFGLWAVVEKVSGKLIGYCGMHKVKINESEEKPELAYRIYKKLWGKGYATEAAMAVRDYAFNVLKLLEIVSCIAHDNERSARVAEKVGLTYWKEGMFKGKPCRVYRLEPKQ